MKVNPPQLADQLRKRLHPAYLVTGDEPLLVQEACDQIREAARKQGYEERTVFQTDRQFDWNLIMEETQSLSLFSTLKRVEVRLHSGKPGDGRQALERYLEAPPDDVILLVSGPKLDSGEFGKSWYKQWQQKAVHVPVWPVDPGDFPRWLENRARAMGLNLTRHALQQLCERLEGNLLAAHQELERLQLVAGDEPIDDAVMMAGVEDSSRYNAFELSTEALAGHRAHALKILRRLAEEGNSPLAILGVLQRDLKHLVNLQKAWHSGRNSAEFFKASYIRQRSLQKAVEQGARRLSARRCEVAREQCRRVDRAAKGYDTSLPVWSALAALIETLSGR